MTYGQATEAQRAEYEAERDAILEATTWCRYCKAARTRKDDPAAKCSSHRSALRNLFATSPVSENYWVS